MMVLTYLILMLWQMLFVETHFTRCSCNPCDCRDYGSSLWVDCSYRELSHVPESIPTNTTHLDLSHNRISLIYFSRISELQDLVELSLNDNELVGTWFQFSAPHLKKLYLHRNKLTFLSRTAFADMPNLAELMLQENGLVDLDTKVFSTQESLLYLDLSSNQISDNFPPGIFRSLVSLTTLNVDNNHLTSLHDNQLLNCRQLEVFSAANNSLFLLGPEGRIFRKNFRLREVNLANNMLMSLHSAEFSDSWHLESINVSNNAISFFYPESFKMYLRVAWKLKLLDLSNNRLEDLPFDMLTELSAGSAVVALNDNMFDCNPLFLFRLTSYMASTRNELLSLTSIQCSEPKHLMNQVVGDFKCPTGSNFSICAMRSEPRCDEPYIYPAAGSDTECTSRCVCPPNKPININGVCSVSEMCSFLDIGKCFKERTNNLYGASGSSYVARCDAEGNYLPLQCQDGICWCTDREGLLRCPMFYEDKETDETCSTGAHSVHVIPPDKYPPGSICRKTRGHGALEEPHKTCAIYGNGRFRQYDGSLVQVNADCYYGLLNDVSENGRYHLYARFSRCGASFCIPSIHLYINRTKLIRITSDFTMYFNSTVTDIRENSTLMMLDGAVRMFRTNNTLRLNLEHLEIMYSTHDYLIVTLNTNEMPDVVGACGSTSTDPNRSNGRGSYLTTTTGGYSMFEEWKLIQSCRASVQLFEVVGDEGNEKCQLLDFGLLPTVVSQYVSSCEADVARVEGTRSVCGNLAAMLSEVLHQTPEVAHEGLSLPQQLMAMCV